MAFGALPSNPDSLKPMFMAPEPEPKRTKRLSRHATTKFDDQEAMKDDENKYYLQKIQEFVNQKMAFFSGPSSSSHHDQKSKPAIKDAKPPKKPANKRAPSRSRSRSPTDDDDDHEEEFKIKKQKKTKKILPVISNETTERLNKFVTEELNGSEMKLVIQKQMYASDIAPGQNRLNIPVNQVVTPKFLRPDEKQLLDGEGSIDVPLLGPTLKLYENPMKLAKWHMKTTSNYILKTNWNQFVIANNEDLTVKTIVQVWSFRRDEKLCLALVCVGRVEED